MYSDSVVSVTMDGGRYCIEVANVISTENRELLVNLGGSSAPVLCIQDHGEINGFFVADSVEEGANSRRIFCHRSKENNSYVEENYRLDIQENDRLQLRRRKPVEENAERATVNMLPPLTFRTRTSVFNIDKIDTINQSFQADFYCELRLVDFIDEDDKEAVEVIFNHYTISLSLIDFLNVSEVVGDKEVWTQTGKGKSSSIYTYVIKLRMKAVINEQMEVQNFPFDIQPMTIGLTFNACTSRVGLEANNYYPSIFFVNQFQSASVYDVLYNDIVLTEVKCSNPTESSGGYVYPRCIFSIYFSRRPAFYMTNVMMPMTVLTLLGPLSNAIEADGSVMGTGDRLSVSLTLLLTAVAYKFIVASSLPQVSYLTALDTQVLICFGFLVISAIENVLYPYLSARTNVIERSFELYFVICYYGGFVLCNFLFFAKLGWWLYYRSQFFANDYFTRCLMRDTYQELGRAKVLDENVSDYVIDQVLAKNKLDRCVPLTHPRHLYALGNLYCKVSSKVDDDSKERIPLVAKDEILSHAATYVQSNKIYLPNEQLFSHQT